MQAKKHRPFGVDHPEDSKLSPRGTYRDNHGILFNVPLEGEEGYNKFKENQKILNPYRAGKHKRG